jgi:hypothetical protein
LARVDATLPDQTAFQADLKRVLRLAETDATEELPLDQRISLAVVLTHARERDRAKGQVQRCWSDATVPEIQKLSTGLLYRWLVMTKGYRVAPEDPVSLEKARSLLPPSLRAKVGG